ncbi:restriction endonuclease subunit S [Mycolicibacterium conceptionense]|uniref:restriction endonuclease subunit S n=1 Tax=Mycolicibacterium conceptionense TaxID=451644 RepID=UPI001F2D02BA|nr:restriction endonuclease subunit S [Mycolicibacterium conceptionense]
MLDAAKNVGVPKPYLGNRAVQWGRIDVSVGGIVPMTRSDLQRYRLRDGDLLVCEGGDVGRGAIWRNELPECYYQKALHRLRAKRGYDARLMLAFLEYWSSIGAFSDFVTQTSIAHLPREKFVLMPLPLPLETEQRRIGDALQEAEDLIAALERLIAKKQAIKQGMMQQLLTGRTRLPGFNGPLRSGVLGDIADVIMGQSPAGASYNRDGAGVPLINGPTEFTDRHPTVKQWTTDPVRFCEPEDILICVRGSSTGRMNTADRPYCIGRGIAAVRAKGRNDQNYIRYALDAVVTELLKLQSGSTFPSIDSRVIRGGRVRVPEPAEQHSIGEALWDVDEQLAALHVRLDKMRDIKAGMMQQLLTGRTRLLVEATS